MGFVEERLGQFANMIEVAWVQVFVVKHPLKQGASGVGIIDRHRFHVARAVGVGAKRFVAVPFDPLPMVGVLVVIDVIVAG